MSAPLDRDWWHCPRSDRPCGVVFSAAPGYSLLLCPVCKDRCEKLAPPSKRPGRDLMMATIRRALDAFFPDAAHALAVECERWLNGACRTCQKRLPFTKASEKSGVCPQCRGGARNSQHAKRKREQRECAHEWEPAQVQNAGPMWDHCNRCNHYELREAHPNQQATLEVDE